MRMMEYSALLILTAILGGCSGLEIGGKAWIMKVDEAASSQKTNATPPLKCLFVNCKQEAAPAEEAQGS